ncbi:MAG: lactate racemase domain-containing protein [Gemmataceae bacterium]
MGEGLSMVALEYGKNRLTLELGTGQLIAAHHGPAPLSDPADAVATALEKPFDYPALRLALTPDDHVTVVVDVPGLDSAALLVPVLENLTAAGLAPQAITLLVERESAGWIDDLPDHLDEVHVEGHSSAERTRLAYLATTKKGRRLYLNRTLVESDQVVVLTQRRYDAVTGYAGGAASLFPTFSDEPTLQEVARTCHLEPPGDAPWPWLQEANEVAWLLGQPFYVQLIPAAGGGVSAVLAGAGEALAEGQRALDRGWRVQVPRRADCVVAAVSGKHVSFAELASAAWNACRVVRPGGRVVLLHEGSPPPDATLEQLTRYDDAQEGLSAMEKAGATISPTARTWARAVSHARVSLLGRLDPQLVEDLSATPLEKASQVQRLVAGSGECILLQDAQTSLALLA